MTPNWLRQDGRDWIVRLRVQPRSGRDSVGGVLDGRLRIRITAPPVDGKANLHLQRFLADWLGLARRQVQIEQGESARDKRVRLEDVGELPLALRDLMTSEPDR